MPIPLPALRLTVRRAIVAAWPRPIAPSLKATKLASFKPPSTWATLPITRIEDLRDAVLGAGLDAAQMSSGSLSGGIAFAQGDGMVFSSGRIEGRVTLTGSLSEQGVTLGIGLVMPPGTRHWLSEVESGEVGVFLPGDEHDALYPPGAIYASVTLSAERLEAEAATRDLVLDRRTLGGTRVHARALPPEIAAVIRESFRRVHAGDATAADAEVGARMLDALVGHLARRPVTLAARYRPDSHGRILARARSYILAGLAEPLSVDEIAAAAGASRRTLYRAFADILDETPQAYIRRLRLHRIRHDLANDAERACSIGLVANGWGMSDLGRMAASYRALFGEKPSETLAKAGFPASLARSA